MCGIIGQIADTNINREDFEHRLASLQHRGPDDSGIYDGHQVLLGHTRLSILDLSHNGHQPMADESGQYIIVFNGEIYNFNHLKTKLQQKGYRFRSNSDTEVILNGYIEYGDEIVRQLNGMFAFAIYNKSDRKLFLARDRSGIKPLYYFQDSHCFAFASEIKALKSFSDGIDQEAKVLFLLLGSVPEPMTIYENIHMFPAGHYAYFADATLKTTCYNTYSYTPKITKSYDEIVKDVQILLHKSIQRHLVSDAPIGTFLSGGLDSSAITAIAAQYKERLHTLSLVFNEKDLSEAYYQDIVVDRYRTEHTKYLIDDTLFLSSIDAFTASFDQPSIDGLNTFFVSKAARESGLKTVLSGIGGDEIFYGYGSFRNAGKLKMLSRMPKLLVSLLQQSRKYKKLELLQIDNALSCYLPTRGLFTPTEIAKLMEIDRSMVYQTISKLWEMYNSAHIDKSDDTISFFELNLYMKNQLLRDADVFGMANSLEIRVPFLDKALVDYVLCIEPKHKYDRKTNKIILADAVKELLPPEILHRPKMGFTLPFAYWFRKHIDTFDIDPHIKKRFANGVLHWSRVWALLVLKRFEKGGQ